MRLLAVALALLVLTPFAGAATRYTAVGTFSIAGGALPQDACTNKDLQGVTSTCSYVPADATGQSFTLSAGAPGALTGLKLCQYTSAGTQIGCIGGAADDKSARLTGAFAATATHFSVTSMSGSKVTWYLSTA